ncbi:hypothetical protein EKK58_04430 [Candidatus Dependentiae bacterium]|nr:MAG: hypothetical protein EKK58_04430 [Candidatus Dependentiae bacterium]
MRLLQRFNNTALLGSMFFLASTAFVITGDPIQGIIDTVTEVTPSFFNYSQSYWFAQSQTYTKGGVSFTWPTYFTDVPMVVVSVSSNGVYSSSGEVVATVVNNTQNGCEVYVTVSTLSTIGEAATDSFVVHVFAVQAGL